MAAYRYWRMGVTRASTAAYTDVAEVRLRTVSGGANQAAAATVSASDTFSAFVPANTVDGNLATVWSAYATTSATWLLFDFSGAPKDFVEADVVASATQPEYTPATVFFEASNDGVNWVLRCPIYRVVSPTASQVFTIDISAAVPQTFRARGAAWTLGDRHPAGPLIARSYGRWFRYDAYDGGTFRISGTVAIDDSPDIPVKRRVRLFDRRSARVIRETTSDETTGFYSFEKIKYQEYFVVAFDDLLGEDYNAVIKDRIWPEAT
jgi:hypothetical protein